MTANTADFEAGTNGSNVNAADAGSLTAWSNVFSTHPTYDTSWSAYGTKSAKVAALGQMEWNFSAETDFYGRAYFFLPGNPSGLSTLMYVGSSGTPYGAIGITSGGKVRVTDFSGANQNGTVSVATSQAIRIEFHVVHSATVGSIVAKLYNSAASITPDETITLSNCNTQASGLTMRCGEMSTFSFASALWIDQIVGNAPAFPGPFPVNTVAPAVTGTTAVGATLTCDGGTWNGGQTFTLTYQWTKAGVNIAAATASTYVTVSGDVGSAIGCKTTATGVQATNEAATQASGNTITPVAASTNVDHGGAIAAALYFDLLKPGR